MKYTYHIHAYIHKYIPMYLIFRWIYPAVYLKSIEGDILLITGGGSGIGRLMAIKLANLGAVIVTWDVNTKGNEETVR